MSIFIRWLYDRLNGWTTVLDAFAFLLYLFAFWVDLRFNTLVYPMAEDIHWWRKAASLLLWLCKLVSCKVGQAACLEKLFSSHLWCIRWQTVLESYGEHFDTCCVKSDSRVLQWKNFPGISFTCEDWCDYGDFEFVDICWDLPHREKKVGILLKFLGQPLY